MTLVTRGIKVWSVGPTKDTTKGHYYHRTVCWLGARDSCVTLMDTRSASTRLFTAPCFTAPPAAAQPLYQRLSPLPLAWHPLRPPFPYVSTHSTPPPLLRFPQSQDYHGYSVSRHVALTREDNSGTRDEERERVSESVRVSEEARKGEGNNLSVRHLSRVSGHMVTPGIATRRAPRWPTPLFSLLTVNIASVN